jgi:hypothetical protein
MIARPARRFRLALLLLPALLAALPAAAQLVPVGEPIELARPSQVVLAADGRFAAIWAAGGGEAGGSLWMQSWSWDGEPLAPPLRLDAERPIAGTGFTAAAAPDGSGDFVVAWPEGEPGRFAYRRASLPGDLAPVETQVLSEEVWGVPSVALGPGSELSWAWSELVEGFGFQDSFLRLRVRPAGGTTIEVTTAPYLRSLRLRASAAGTLWLAWEEYIPGGGTWSDFAVLGPLVSDFVHAFSGLTPYHGSPLVGLDGIGRALLVVDSLGVSEWQGEDGVCSGVFARPAAADGGELGRTVQVNPLSAGCQLGFAAEGSSSGGFLVVWKSVHGAYVGDGDSSQDGLWLRTYGSDGAPLGDPLRFAGGNGLTTADYESGRAVVGVGPALHRFAAPPVACAPGAAHLCLGGGRFRVEVDQRNPYPPLGEGIGRAVPLTADTGAFWFFHPDNLELMLKVLDGRVVNDHWWVFSAGLSTVEHWIMVFDGATGEQALSHNRPFELASRADTAAFPSAAGAAPAGGLRLAAHGPDDAAAEAPEVAPEIPACDDPAVLCLHDDRFALRIAWHDPRSGDAGPGLPRPITADTGSFWFFHPANLEVMVKVLDGRPVDGHWWVFAGSLSDVEYTLEVIDRASGLVRRYENAPFTLGSHADTAAFTD